MNAEPNPLHIPRLDKSQETAFEGNRETLGTEGNECGGFLDHTTAGPGLSFGLRCTYDGQSESVHTPSGDSSVLIFRDMILSNSRGGSMRLECAWNAV